MILMIADGGDDEYMKIAIKVAMILMIADGGDNEYMKIVIRWHHYSHCCDMAIIKVIANDFSYELYFNNFVHIICLVICLFIHSLHISLCIYSCI